MKLIRLTLASLFVALCLATQPVAAQTDCPVVIVVPIEEGTRHNDDGFTKQPSGTDGPLPDMPNREQASLDDFACRVLLEAPPVSSQQRHKLALPLLSK